jgi:hypothetical protein
VVLPHFRARMVKNFILLKLYLVFSKIGAQDADGREIYIDEFLVNLVIQSCDASS